MPNAPSAYLAKFVRDLAAFVKFFTSYFIKEITDVQSVLNLNWEGDVFSASLGQFWMF